MMRKNSSSSRYLLIDRFFCTIKVEQQYQIVVHIPSLTSLHYEKFGIESDLLVQLAITQM